MDYEVEEKIATKKWEKQGNADVYKNDDVTLVVCKNDRYNLDYETFFEWKLCKIYYFW